MLSFYSAMTSIYILGALLLIAAALLVIAAKKNS